MFKTEVKMILKLKSEHKHTILEYYQFRNDSRNSRRRFPLVVDPRCRGLGAQPPAADKVLVFQIMKFNVAMSFI